MKLKTKDIIKKSWPYFIIGPAVKMIEAIFDLLIPLFMKAIIDLCFSSSNDIVTNSLGSFIKSFGTWIPNNPELNYSIIGGFIILIMGITGFCTTMVCQYIAAKTATAVGTELRDNLYQKILSLSKKEREMMTENKMLTILNSDSYQVQQGVLFFIRLGIRAPFIILGSLVISFILDYQIGLIFLAIIPIILTIVFLVMMKSSKKYLEIQSKLDVLSNKTSDNIAGTRVVRAFNRQEYEEKSFKSHTASYQKEAIRVGRLNSLINPLTFAIVAIATIAVVFIGGFSMNAGVSFFGYQLLPSTIITLVSYLTQIFQTLVLLTNLIQIFTKSLVSMKRCDQLLQLESSIKCDGTYINKNYLFKQPYLVFNHVYLSYKENGNYALTDLNFTLNKGESLGIIGPTGSGKSSIIKLIERFLDATEGTLLYKGQDIKNYSLKDLRKEIGYVPQKANLFKGTILSNFKMADDEASNQEIEKALKIAKAHDFVKAYNDYLQHEVEEKGMNFSGGQRQRLTIARALIRKPELLILDDSTSALDLLTDKEVRNNISKSYPNLTKIIVSQRVSTISDCDLILVLEGGKIIAQGKHDELLKTCKTYEETYLSQAKRGD